MRKQIKKAVDLPFHEHLVELRARLINSLIVILICSCAFYAFIDNVLAVILAPVGRLFFTAPAEAFWARMILTVLGGFFLSLPVLFYHIWKFIELGLTEKEKKYIRLLGPLSFFFFVGGGLFAYFVMIPISLKFLLSFSSDLMVPMITVYQYISFVGTLIFACGIIFELPLVILFLAKIGIATPESLREKRKYAIILILIASALLTPPDVITQILMSVPLLMLYEIGIIFARLAKK